MARGDSLRCPRNPGSNLYRPIEVLHIGDHNLSSVHMFFSFLEDVEALTHSMGDEATSRGLP